MIKSIHFECLDPLKLQSALGKVNSNCMTSAGTGGVGLTDKRKLNRTGSQ